MYAEVSLVNETKGYRFSESGVFETFTDDIKRLFQSFQREYGKCVSKVYIDTEEQKHKAIGWVFQKNVQYEDSKDTYIQEAWVTLYKSAPITTVTYDYVELE